MKQRLAKMNTVVNDTQGLAFTQSAAEKSIPITKV